MKQWFKTYWYIWVPALILIVWGIIWAINHFSSPEEKVKFGFRSGSDDQLRMLLPMLESRYALRGSDPNAKGIGLYLDVPLTAIVKNKDNKDISLQNIAGTLSYEGSDILQTRQGSNINANVKANKEKPVTDTFQILINEKTIKYIKEYLKGTKPKLNYSMSAKLFDDIYTFKDSAILNETAPSETTGNNNGSGNESTGGRG